ncbi:hypothetical protein F2P81_021671 [Scophthalmus maximus]|uniref:Uncharacterized protein n=1 Tax=Scophthalmus maximus TaxID=52904 RepID=A0A6A4S8I0_SCOMX|nr:hypothetical protein F2P81_021671 [Scophthalmus maximus]
MTSGKNVMLLLLLLLSPAARCLSRTQSVRFLPSTAEHYCNVRLEQSRLTQLHADGVSVKQRETTAVIDISVHHN